MRIQVTVLLLLTFFNLAPLMAKTQTTPSDTEPGSESTAIQQEKEKIELEKLQLEDAELKLKLMKVQAQLSPVPTSTPAPAPPSNNNSDQAKQALETFKSTESRKAEDLAKTNKDKTDLMVLDLVNAEVWYKGVRYGAYELNNLATDQGWKFTKKVDARDPAGYARYLYTYQNVSLLKYESHDRGIFSMKAPLHPGDMDFLTPEGVSFASSSGDVRTNFGTTYFTYDSQGEEKNQKILKYRHGEGLGFNGQMELWFDRQGKMTQIRFGVLGER